ncbi:MAG TPA: aconitase family protein [Candidatus Polarisedimenticolia bacterium]|nr:aconitase family protein [Candidatus Polarisedimenticolia bacterium]
MSQNPIEPPRLKPGVTIERILGSARTEAVSTDQGHLITGRALIFWDPKRPGRKLDAIDTDQITPAADCVSESLETLDARWKAGSFRYLMPDFAARVRRGENFLVAGDRFAIGSSREMSPAGLKGVAEDAGREMVIVCGDNMGDIFRRNALNLGLHVAQSPGAVTDARDGDELRFDTRTRELTNVTQGKTYPVAPLTSREEEIRRSGGIFAVGRRDFLESLRTPPAIEFPPPAEARGMTTTEQIVWSHRVDRKAKVAPGETLRVYADLLPASDGTGPFAIYTFDRITGGDTVFPSRAAFASDHFVFTGKDADERQTSISREFAMRHGIRSPHFATPGDGIFHFYFPEQGLIVPGGFYPGADSHSRAYGAYGAVGIGVGSTTLGYGWATGAIYFTLARQRRVVFGGKLQPWVNGKDVVLELLRRWGAAQSRGMSVEFVDADRQLPIPFRNTIANMMAEGEAQNGIFAQDAITTKWFEERGIALPYPPISPGEDARYEIDETLDLSEVVPLVAKPYSPGNAYPAEEIAKERITFDKALIGSCTNGGYEDLLGAALVVRAARDAGATRVAENTQFVIFPGSGLVKKRIENPDPRLGGESIAEVLRSVGGVIRESWCGPCFGQGPDALVKGQRAITSFNRNWQNRMGVGGEGYLASPQVVAASALLGYIASPSELGLAWRPEQFAV